MTQHSAPHFCSFLQRMSKYAGTTAIAVGSIVLVGWAFDIPLLKSVLPRLATMKANTAVSFLLAGVSLRLLQPDQADRFGRRSRRWIGQVCALTVTLVGLLTLIEYLAGLDLGIDQLLILDPGGGGAISAPGQMAPATALSFLLLGCSLLLLDVETRRGYLPAQLFAMVVALISLLALIGYAYGVQSLYAIAPYSSVALHTAVMFIVLSHGLLFARPDREFMVAITSECAGGVMARRLVPAALWIPLVLGWLGMAGTQMGYYDSAFGFALFATSTMIIFVGLIWWNALSLDRTDRERKQAERGLRLNAAALEAAANGIIITDRQGTIIWVNPAYTRLTGYSLEEMLGQNPRVLKSGHHPPAFYRRLWETILSGQIWYGEVINRRKDGSLYAEEQTITPVWDERGEISHFVAIKQDVTDRKRAELRITSSLKEKEVLLREVYHRVKNNLQVVSSLLNLQAGRIRDPQDAEMFRDSQNRIRSMALIHQKLCQSGDLAEIDFAEYTRDLVNSLFRSYGVDPQRVGLTIDVKGVRLTLDAGITCGLIINELTSNSIKHAFPNGRKGEIAIVAYLADDHEVHLTIADNGVGLPVGLNFSETDTLGLQLVNILVKQLRGEIDLHRNGGTEFRVRFKEVADNEEARGNG